MQQSLPRDLGVRLHTHLCETIDEENYVLEKYGKRPLAYMEDMNWVGNDVWYAHGIHFNDEELNLLAQTGTGVAHCPISNMKLSSRYLSDTGYVKTRCTGWSCSRRKRKQ